MASVTRLRLAILTNWSGNQNELAQRCGIRFQRLSEYALGDRVIPGHHRALLAHVLKVDPSELDGWEAGERVWSLVGAST